MADPPTSQGPPASDGARALRPARALIGWMEPEVAERALLQYRVGGPPDPAALARVQSARAAVLTRSEGVDQASLIHDAPSELRSHLSRLSDFPGAAAYFKEGWSVKTVDLPRVAAFQPQVFISSASERVRHAKAGDLPTLAELALPTANLSEALAPTFDPRQQAWSASSSNPNLRIVGNVAGPLEGIPPGSIALGFFVALLPSFMQVARFQGRYFLRDGYHRALGLLMAGITRVPAFVNDVPEIERLAPPGMLPQAAFLGNRPPTLQDYLDDTVAASVQAPSTRKLVLVQGIELNI